MAFPSIRSESETLQTGSDSTSWSFVLADTVSAGDLLLSIVAWDGTAATLTWDNATAGTWTNLTDTISTSGAEVSIAIYAKVADGTEDAATLTLGFDVAERGTMRSYAIQDWHGTIATGIDLVSTDEGGGSTANHNPAEVTAQGGAGDNLFIVHTTCSGNNPVTGYPTNFADNQSAMSNNSGGGIADGFATYNYSATAALDPDGFTNASCRGVTTTFAIRPVGVADSTAPTTDTAPAIDSVTTTTITVDGTFSDETDSTINFYAVAVANGDGTPSDAQIKLGQNSGGTSALADGSDLGVSNGVEASITLTGVTAGTEYDVHCFAEDQSDNATTVYSLDATTASASRTAVIQDDTPLIGETITVDLTNFSGAPTGATLTNHTDTVSLSISNASSSSVDVTFGAYADFVSGGDHENTELQTALTLTINEAGGSATDSVQIQPIDTDGPTYFYGTATTPSGESVFPAGTAAGDEYFLEVVSGTISVVNTDGSIAASTSSYEVNTKIWDESAEGGLGQWSEVFNVTYSPSSFKANPFLSTVFASAAIR